MYAMWVKRVTSASRNDKKKNCPDKCKKKKKTVIFTKRAISPYGYDINNNI